jgi:hypothetical protein
MFFTAGAIGGPCVSERSMAIVVEAIKKTISLPLDTTDTAELLPEVMAAQDPISLDTKNTKFMMVLMPPSCYRKPWPHTIFLPK